MKNLLLAAACFLPFGQAQAATMLTFDADMLVTTVTENTFYDPNCATPGNMTCAVTTTATQHFTWTDALVSGNLAQGQQFTFTADHNRGGFISGTAYYLGGGQFQPIAASYTLFPSCGGLTCSTYRGSTTSFTLTDPLNPAVPEPATWATLLLGLFFIAGALRWRHRPTLAYA